MNDTKELLRKIAALRQRLTVVPKPEADDTPAVRSDASHALEKKVEQGAWHNRLIDRSLRPLDAATSASPSVPAWLTASGQRLLLKGRSLLQALRTLADDPAIQDDPNDPLAALHSTTIAMIDTMLRVLQAFPPSASEQLRLCQGTE